MVKRIDAVVSCLKSSTQMSKHASEFESKISKLFSEKYGLFVNSGSSALYLGMEAAVYLKDQKLPFTLTFQQQLDQLLKIT